MANLIRAKLGLQAVFRHSDCIKAISGCTSGVDAQAIISFCSHCKGLISYYSNSRKNPRLAGQRMNNGL
ncbi:hypothetical protein ACFOY8_07975 [Thalassospira xianhensis]|uniref:hypothetical protein n=1 Tax=Thalassospira xianhensis TaxID=478503 RepID=UPI0011BF52B2|nr:hypothetical protein [Thalassospira xianhensis]